MASDPMRKQYRELSDDEREAMQKVKDAGEALLATIDACNDPRMAALARTNAEQAVMWAVKGITG